jgi:hypothetical protein
MPATRVLLLRTVAAYKAALVSSFGVAADVEDWEACLDLPLKARLRRVVDVVLVLSFSSSSSESTKTASG